MEKTNPLDSLTLEQYILLLDRIYQKQVKPLIERGLESDAGDFGWAVTPMSNVSYLLQQRFLEICSLDWGLNYITTAELLEEALGRGNGLLISLLRNEFEKYSRLVRGSLNPDLESDSIQTGKTQ